VVSAKTGHLFEKKLILKYLASEDKCPVTGAPLQESDLVAVVAAQTARPRPITATSIPGLLSHFQNEWDAVMQVHLRGMFCPVRHAVDHWRAMSKAGTPVEARIVTTSSGAGLFGSVSQANYSAAKAGIASFTIVAAAELERYGVRINGIAPSARSRMTEEAFADMMRAPEHGFDAMDPANVSPLVVWLGSSACDVTGRMFETAGGQLSVADGWQHGAVFDKGARYEPDEIGAVVADLLREAPSPPAVYGA